MKMPKGPHWGRDFRPVVEQCEDRVVPGETLGFLQSIGNLLGPLVQLLGPGILFGASEVTRVVEPSDIEIVGQTAGAAPASPKEFIWADNGPAVSAYDASAIFTPVQQTNSDSDRAPTNVPATQASEATAAPTKSSLDDDLGDDMLATDTTGHYRARAASDNSAGIQTDMNQGAAPVAFTRPQAIESNTGVFGLHDAFSGLSENALLAMAAGLQTQQASGNPDNVFAEPLGKNGRQSPPPPPPPPGFSPAQIRQAYGFDQLSQTGKGVTIAIIDAYYTPITTLGSDLTKFNSAFALAPANVTEYYFTTRTNIGWAQESTLDVEWAHAIAPGATIDLVAARSSSYTDLFNAVDFATRSVSLGGLGANVVSMSWGGGEFPQLDSHFQVPNVTFVASSGDAGGVVGYPSTSPYVLSVGGTSLYLDSTTNTYTEAGWSGSGGGPSAYESRPSYQAVVGSSNGASTTYRNTPDVAYVGDPSTGVPVMYNGKWYQFGGTSVGAPQWAALVALADQGRVTTDPSTSHALSTTQVQNALYSWAYNSDGSIATTYSTYFHDVTAGTAGSYSAGPGYDLVTGLGSPRADHLVPDLNSL